MSSSALTTENSAVVMIDHAVGFGNVFRSHDLALHVNNTVGLAKTAGVFGIPLVLTNGADTGPYGPLFSELRAVTGGARVIVREANFINAFQTPEFAAAIESAGRTPPRVSRHCASVASVVSARSSAANRTNRNRHHASTAQNTCSPPSAPQSITRCSPGDHTAGRRLR